MPTTLASLGPIPTQGGAAVPSAAGVSTATRATRACWCRTKRGASHRQRTARVNRSSSPSNQPSSTGSLEHPTISARGRAAGTTGAASTPRHGPLTRFPTMATAITTIRAWSPFGFRSTRPRPPSTRVPGPRTTTPSSTPPTPASLWSSSPTAASGRSRRRSTWIRFVGCPRRTTASLLPLTRYRP